MMTLISAPADVALTPFERHVKRALKLYAHPERLGQESPLARPYMLGRALRDLPRPITVRALGEVLRAELHAAATRLWRGRLPANRTEMLEAIADVRRNPDDPRYMFIVLELRCFHTWIIPNRTSDIWEQPHLLPGSKSQHYREYDEAVKRLAAVLLDRLRPALRPERPRPPELLIGYGRQLAILTDALARGHAVSLNGPGGVGKTSIAAAALARLDRHPLFWYTLRPGFNDGVSSLLFALGAFLHEQGAANLWQYLLMTNGVVADLNLAAGLLRQDLALFTEYPPVLCFDDLEFLASSTLDLLTTRQTQLLDLIDGLRGATPLLLISQRALPAGDVNLELTGLRVPDLVELWCAAGYELTPSDAEQIYTYTGGNPRLLTLLLTLQRQTGELPLPSEQAVPASLLPAFQRLWHRLRPEERRSIERLSVYQGYAPEDILDAQVLDGLDQLRLVERDGAGGITLLPALASLVYDDLSPELREKLHREAALVHLERGEYTTAAHHFVRGNQENQAVQVWFPQRRHATARGEADIARTIFTTISRQRLGKAERKALDLIRVELRQLAGQYEEGLRELEYVDWADASETSGRLWMLRGELQDALGYPDQALASYDEGLRVTARLLGQLSSLHHRRGLLLHHRRDLQASWQEIHRGEFNLEMLRGAVREEEGAYQEALEAYRRARALAEQLDDDPLRARAERGMSKVYGRRQHLEEAAAHAAQAIAIYERMGDRVSREKLRSNLSAIYVQSRQFAAALEVGVPAYDFFVAIRDPYFTAVTAANLAEASYELGDLAMATHYAGEVLTTGERFAAPYARFTLGQVELARHNPTAAAGHFHESLQSARRNDDPYMVAYAQRALGQALLSGGDFAAARHQLTDALALFRQLDIPSEIATTEHLLADLVAGQA